MSVITPACRKVGTSPLWDFMDSYYRSNWFLKAFGDRPFT